MNFNKKHVDSMMHESNMKVDTPTMKQTVLYLADCWLQNCRYHHLHDMNSDNIVYEKSLQVDSAAHVWKSTNGKKVNLYLFKNKNILSLTTGHLWCLHMKPSVVTFFLHYLSYYRYYELTLIYTKQPPLEVEWYRIILLPCRIDI